jgi:2'-5' RNA ligase
MKLLIENWKRFINENEEHSDNGTLVLQGILLLHPNEQIKSQLIQLANEVKEKNADAIPLQPDKMHLTLAHQSVFKDKEVAKKLKELIASNTLKIPEIKLGEVVVKIGEGDQQGRKTWAVKIQNQKDFKDFVDDIKQKVDSTVNEPQERVFHFSLANLTGNPGDSVR